PSSSARSADGPGASGASGRVSAPAASTDAAPDRSPGQWFPHDRQSHSSKTSRRAPTGTSSPPRSSRTYSEGIPASAGTTSAEPHLGHSGRGIGVSPTPPHACAQWRGSQRERLRPSAAGRRRVGGYTTPTAGARRPPHGFAPQPRPWGDSNLERPSAFVNLRPEGRSIAASETSDRARRGRGGPGGAR